MKPPGEHPHYELLESLGEGGMGVVYKALDRRLNRIVALKFPIANQNESPEAIRRFRHEAEAIAALNHPGIATIFEAGVWEGRPFLALEYLSGGTLKDRKDLAGADIATILNYAKQLGAGLSFAHSKGILHRDIKPGNCMFSAHDSLKLVDFGLAKALDRANDGDDITRVGTVVGTAAYMAPELLTGEPASVKSDLYALGAVVYEVASGTLLYGRTGGGSVSERVLKGAATPLAQLRPDLPAAFCGAVSRATSLRAADRQDSVDQFLEELSAGFTGSAVTETLAMAAAPQTAPQKAKRRVALALTGVALVATAIGVKTYLFLGDSSHAIGTMVVLPFENLGADPANRALCDGLQETVTSILSSAPELRSTLLIVPSSEIRRSQIRTITEARKQFSATLALTGSTQHEMKDLLLTLSLNDARLVNQKDSRILPVKTNESAGLQRQLAEALGSLLGAGPLLSGQRRNTGETTASSVAYDLFLQGRGALEDRNVDSAMLFLTKSVAADPSFALARAKLAEAYLRKNLETKDPRWLALADREIGKAAQSGQSPEVLMSQAMIRRATGNRDQAIELFGEVLKSDRGNVEAFRFLGETLDAAGKLKEAEGVYRQGLGVRPGYWPLYESLGDFYSRHGQYGKAEQAFSTGLGLAAETPSLYYNLGAMYFRMSRWDDAAKAFEKSLAVRPTAVGYGNLGTVLFFQGKYAEAAREMEEATKLQPANPVNWGNLGDALWQLPTRRKEALDAFERAAALANRLLAINPGNARLRKNYALYLAKLGRPAEAGLEARRAVAQVPEDGSTHYYAARVFFLTGDSAGALDALQKSIALGYSAQEIRQEPDFLPMKSDPRFLRITGKDNAVH